MKPLRDPEQAELGHLLEACELADKEVLDIGCGDGDFTRQYYRFPRHVTGIDPLASDLRTARAKARTKTAFFLQGKAEGLPFPRRIFDIVLFTCSL